MAKNPIHDWLNTLNAKKMNSDGMHFDARGALETMTAGLAPLKTLTVLNMELLRWSSRRAQAFLSIPQRLAGCKTQQDVFQEQQRFWETAYTQNQEALLRVAQVWSELFGLSSPFSEVKGEGASTEQSSLIKFPTKSSPQDRHTLTTSPSKPRVFSS